MGTVTLENTISSTHYFTIILSWLMILTSFSKFVLTVFPLALGFEEIISPMITSEQVMLYASILIKVTLTIASYAVAVYFPSFSFLCSIVGLVCTIIVSVIFPASAHLKLFWH